MKRFIVICGLVLGFTACTPQQALIKQTASGYPEGVFPDSTIEVVRSKIFEGCSSRGIPIQDTSGNQVVCGKTMEGGEAIMAQMLIGNSYSTTPELKVRFIIYQLDSNVKVTAQQWIESQMAYGQVRRIELNANHHKNDLQNFLSTMGAQ